MRSICVFCGSSLGKDDKYAQAARRLAVVLAEHNIRIIYGAGSLGLMGLVADQALACGGQVVGIIPEHLCRKEVVHEGLSELHVTDSLLDRKLLMMELAEGFIALPGGLGTFDEILEVYSWAQLGRHSKPLGLVNTLGYFDRFLGVFDYAIDEGFLAPEFRARFTLDPDPVKLLDKVIQRLPGGRHTL